MCSLWVSVHLANAFKPAWGLESTAEKIGSTITRRSAATLPELTCNSPYSPPEFGFFGGFREGPPEKMLQVVQTGWTTNSSTRFP